MNVPTQPHLEPAEPSRQLDLQSSNHPYWLLLSLTLPQVLLWLAFFYQYILIQSLLSDKSKGYWADYGMLIGAGIVGSIFVACFFRYKRHPLPAWLAPLLLFGYIGLLYFSIKDMPQLLPFNIPQWMSQREELSLLPFAFTMPVLFHALLMLIAYFTPNQDETASFPNFFYALLIPLIWYFFIQILVPYLRTKTYLSERLFLIFFICTTVCFFFFLLRGVLLALRKNQKTSRYAPFWRLLIALILPLAGLVTYNARSLFGMRGMHTPQIVGELSHPLFYLCAILAAGALLAPSPLLPRARLALFSLRMVVYPYTLFFFVIFLPFLPLSLLAILVMGLGFLMLAPTLLMILHSRTLAEEWRALRLHYRTTLLGLVAVLSFFAVPSGILTYLFQERATLHRALAYLYQPDHLRVQAPDIYPALLRNSIDALRQHHQRRRGRRFVIADEKRVPFLTSLYKSIVLDNMTLSQNKINELSQTFLGNTSPSQTTTARLFRPNRASPSASLQPLPPQTTAISPHQSRSPQNTVAPTSPLRSPQSTVAPTSQPNVKIAQPSPASASKMFTPSLSVSTQTALSVTRPTSVTAATASTHATTQPTAAAAQPTFRMTTPKITHLQTSTHYDPTIHAYKSTILLRITNYGTWQQEFSTSFQIPLGVWASAYALWIDGKKVDGALTEKKATLWVYQQIVRARQDPGLLYYEDATTLRLRVFPVLARETRQTSFTLLHKAPFSFQIGASTHHLDDSRVLSRMQRPIERLWGDHLLFFPHEQKAKLPTLTRKPYLHAILDCSQGRKSHYALYIEQIRKLHQRYNLDPTHTRVTFANYQAHTSAWSADLLQHLESYPAQGGLFLVRVLKRIYLEHATQARDSFPVVVVLTPRIQDAILKQRLQGVPFLSPDAASFYSLNPQDRFTRHSLYGPLRDQEIQNTDPATFQPFSLGTVRAWPDAQHPRVFLRNDGQDSLVLRVPSVAQMPPTALPNDPWQAGLAIYGRWLLQQLRLGGQENWLAQIRWSWYARILGPQTSFTVLENQAQWEALRRKQQQVLAGKSFFDLTEDEGPRRADEPPLGGLVLLLGMFFFYFLRKTRKARSQN